MVKNAHSIGYVGSFRRPSSAKMGFLTAIYGLGALIAPLISTQFANARHWSFHFLTSLAIALADTIALALIFRGRTQNGDFHLLSLPYNTHSLCTIECLAEIDQDADAETLAAMAGEREKNKNPFISLMRLRAVHCLAAFVIIYVGTEVTIGGWTVTFIITDRGGGENTGYISTGFFAGLFIGRISLLWVNAKLGERLAVFIYSAIAVG
jgi:fucose permease